MSTNRQPTETAGLCAWMSWWATTLSCITTLSFLLPGLSIAQAVEDETTKHGNLIFIVPALIIVIGLVSRVLLKRHMEQLMFSSSEEQQDGMPELLDASEVSARPA